MSYPRRSDVAARGPPAEKSGRRAPRPYRIPASVAIGHNRPRATATRTNGPAWETSPGRPVFVLRLDRNHDKPILTRRSNDESNQRGS